MTRLIVASGGRPRDLFETVKEAAITAMLRNRNHGKDKPKIEEEDALQTMNKMRSQYETRLGDGPYDEEREHIPYQNKADLMRRIYEGSPQALSEVTATPATNSTARH